MDRIKALSLVEPKLTKSRYEHTKRVVNTALDLADKYGEDMQRIELAAIFHDYAKYRDKEEMRRWILTTSLPKDLLSFHHELWHGPVGALLVKQEIGLTDEQILSAIRWHTTGKAGMTKLDKIIFLADYMEPGRDFPGVTEVREEAGKDLNTACWLASRNTINFLISKNRSVYPDTFHAYNDLLLIKNTDGGN